MKNVDLSGLVEEMLELLKISISKHATLRLDLCKSLPAVRGNVTQIRQIVMNLIINASQAIGEKEGVIHIRTSRVAGGRDPDPNRPANLPKATTCGSKSPIPAAA